MEEQQYFHLEDDENGDESYIMFDFDAIKAHNCDECKLKGKCELEAIVEAVNKGILTDDDNRVIVDRFNNFIEEECTPSLLARISLPEEKVKEMIKMKLEKTIGLITAGYALAKLHMRRYDKLW